MTQHSAETPVDVDERDEDLLTRAEASIYLGRFNVRRRPASLARLWSVGGDGPPCRHIRGKPWYPRGALREWAGSQISDLRRSRGSRRSEMTPGRS